MCEEDLRGWDSFISFLLFQSVRKVSGVVENLGPIREFRVSLRSGKDLFKLS